MFGRIVAILALICSVALATPATADEASLDSIMVQSEYSTLELTFDSPITESDANSIRSELSDGEVVESSTSTASDYYWELGCGNKVSFIDGNGTMHLALSCATATKTIPWSFKLSARLRSTVVGLVRERGLSWWRNGRFIGQNAPHQEPYLFHGTMKPVYITNTVEFSDYFTWRHNIGSGGTASLTIAGRVKLI